ncbi:hypothetical protein GCM10023321_74740 [Pseudonocardia eucalypti]|uniref:Uncharacterized protein n=1 Tax=Pseudonocardia eucalypti TaxID=648755 RepID=A0ABP9RB33_9PSEU
MKPPGNLRTTRPVLRRHPPARRQHHQPPRHPAPRRHQPTRHRLLQPPLKTLLKDSTPLLLVTPGAGLLRAGAGKILTGTARAAGALRATRDTALLEHLDRTLPTYGGGTYEVWSKNKKNLGEFDQQGRQTKGPASGRRLQK